MLVARLFAEARPGDIVLAMGAGDIYKVAEALATTPDEAGGLRIHRAPQASDLAAPSGFGSSGASASSA